MRLTYGRTFGRRFDGQTVGVTDMRTDVSCWWYDRRTVDLTDIRTDTSYWWYDRRMIDMFRLNHACDATPPHSTLVVLLVCIKKLWEFYYYRDYLDDTPSKLGLFA